MTRLLAQALLPAVLATVIGASTAQAPVPAPSQATPEPPHPTLRPIALQPLAQHVRQLETALAYLGQPLPAADHAAINEAIADEDEAAAVKRIEAVLDRHVLFEVEINPESRVRVAQGAARPELVEQGSRLFLVKVSNQAGVTATLAVESPNAGRVYVPATGAPDPEPKLTAADTRDKWAELSIYDKPPLTAKLSGLVDQTLESVVAEYRARLRTLGVRTFVQGSPEVPSALELGDLLSRMTAPGQVRVADSGLRGRGVAIFRGDPKIAQRLLVWLEEKPASK